MENFLINEGTQHSVYGDKVVLMRKLLSSGVEINLNSARVINNGSGDIEIKYDGEGNLAYTKELKGVIVYNHQVNTYFQGGYTGESKKPLCQSFDGIVGLGSPGQLCKICEKNKYGSNGAGKACRNRQKVYILREDDIFPIVLTVPTGSLKDFNNYLSRLVVSQGCLTREVITKITVQQGVTTSGIEYSKLVFSADRLLNEVEAKDIESIGDMVSESLGTKKNKVYADIKCDF